MNTNDEKLYFVNLSGILNYIRILFSCNLKSNVNKSTTQYFFYKNYEQGVTGTWLLTEDGTFEVGMALV